MFLKRDNEISNNASNNDLRARLLSFIWRYLKPKKWCLFGITLIAIVHSIEISLKVIRNSITIVIAHRLSTLKDMDRILVFVRSNVCFH